MIYRIYKTKMVDGKRVFDGYVTDEEMNLLRVNTDGKVEKLIDATIEFCMNEDQKMMLRKLNRFVTGEWTAGDDYYSGDCYSAWVMAAEYEVELGVELNCKKYYHNDIFTSLLSLTSCDPKGTKWITEYDNETASFWFVSEHDSEIQFSVLCPDLDKMLTVIGNIHENPELLEVK